MINIKNFSLPLAAVLCTSLLFSCTSELEFPQPKFCQIGSSCKPATSLEDCEKNNGEPKSSCKLTCEIPRLDNGETDATYYAGSGSFWGNLRNEKIVKCNGEKIDTESTSLEWHPLNLRFENPGLYSITVTSTGCNGETADCGNVNVIP